MNGSAVRARGLVKRFRRMTAVAGIDLDIPTGSFFGVVGPNGAGKTTTLSMMTGLLRPTEGAVAILGADVWADPVTAKARIGVLPEGVQLFDRLSGRELLHYTGALRGLPRDAVATRTEELLRVLDLHDAADRMVLDYSTGMRKKVGLAAALLHNPGVLFLDEPFEGVDPVSAGTIRAVLERYTASGSTVIFSSHVMELVERLCDRIAVLDRGRVVAAGEVGEVSGGRPLHEAFLNIVGADARMRDGGLEWLGSSAG